jgi:hypothetical protein
MRLRIPLIIFVCSLFFSSSKLIAQEKNHGYLKFDMNVESALLVVDFDYNNRQNIANGDSVLLLSGTHIIDVSVADRGALSYRLLVHPDSTRTITFRFSDNKTNIGTLRRNYAAQDQFNANVFIITDEESEVYYEGNYLGTGIAPFDAPFKKQKVTVRHPDLGSKSFTIEARDFSKVYELYRKPDRATSNFLSFIPGASQYYKHQHLKAGALFAGSSILLIASSKSSKIYKREKNHFNDLLQQYNNTTDEEEAFRLGNLTENQQDVVTKADNRRRFLIGASVLVYAFNIYDALTSKPASGFKEDLPLDIYLSRELGLAGEYNSATLRVSF